MEATDSPPADYFKFLGTGGARFVVAKQLRASGGIFLHFLGKKMILDPGPGALVRLVRSRPPLDPTSLEAIFLTHKHIDHSNDVNILVEAMTSGGFKKRGVLFAPEECLESQEGVVFNYLKDYLERIEVLTAEKEYRLGELKIRTSVPHLHGAETYGLKIYLPAATVGFLTDTKFFPGLIKAYHDVTLLVMNVVRAKSREADNILHLTAGEAAEIIRGIKPEKAYLTHFGMTMLRADPRKEAEKLAEATGVEVIAAYDGLTVQV
ncbi:MAG: MBL fold metallo-hydrolase [Candidatus Saccharicenans sp.]|jgi:ribonuclease BN (tRNA processing enzyme)|nr:MBL fold metallo-hydrolase [Candidatus Saccharicenans sp.]